MNTNTSNANVVRIPTNLINQVNNFFEIWLAFLQPLHRLTDKEVLVLAAFLKRRFELSRYIKNDEVLDKMLMGIESRAEIKKSCNVKSQHFQVIISKFKKNGIIVNGLFNKRYIPNIDVELDGNRNYKLILLFDVNDDRQGFST